MQTSRSSHHARSTLLFARNFFKHPLMLGAIAPSSQFLVQKLLDPQDWSKAGTVVEFGPGIGTFTQEVLARMPAQGRLLAVEMNRDFVDSLRRSIPDRRLTVVQGSAADLSKHLGDAGLERADYILSGIPFSTMPPDLRDSILSASYSALRPGGKLLVYQYSPRIGRDLRRHFDVVEEDFEWRNLLPARMFFCTRRRGNGAG